MQLQELTDHLANFDLDNVLSKEELEDFARFMVKVPDKFVLRFKMARTEGYLWATWDDGSCRVFIPCNNKANFVAPDSIRNYPYFAAKEEVA